MAATQCIKKWTRCTAKVLIEHQNGYEGRFKWLWTWHGCWCQTGWCQYFRKC